MPDTNFELLKELTRNPFASKTELARKLGMTGPSVHRRLRQLEESGTLQGFVATPVPGVFGRVAVGGFWPASKHIPAEVILEDDVVWAALHVDHNLGVIGYAADPETFLLDFRAQYGEGEFVGKPDYPAGRFYLNSIHWKIMRAMIDRPVGSIRELTEASGLSHKTVKRYRTELMDMGAVLVQPLLREPDNGALFFHVWAILSDRDHDDEIMELFDGSFVAQDYGNSLYLFCWSHSLRDQVEGFETLKGIESVTQAYLPLATDFAQNNDRLRSWIDLELEKLRPRG